MDYSRFRFKAVVDWIDIEIRTVKPTNFQTLQRKLKAILHFPEGKNPHIEAIDEGAGGSATRYRLRIQDPKNWRQITKILQRLEELHRFAEKPKVTAIEVAFDAYSKGEATTDELAELVAYYYRNMTLLVSENRRLYKDYKGSGKAIPRQEAVLARHVKEGWQIGIGNVMDEQYQHSYLKTADNGETLQIGDFRARLEIRLRNAKLPCKSFAEWESFRFELLSPFFRFRQLENGLSPMRYMVAGASAQLGERKERRRAGG